mmetsp:Transcript_9448/g.18184  ORF Transcript_9448/g.18184 Transcript_9448/m.18184 type:complete len:423 (+) Transcript_9448:2586-3854(+)
MDYQDAGSPQYLQNFHEHLHELQGFFEEFKQIENSYDLQNFVRSTTRKYWKNDQAGRLSQLLNDIEFYYLYRDLIPWLAELFSRATDILPASIIYLERGVAQTVEYTLEQLVVLLSLLFFGMIPEPHSWFMTLPTEESQYLKTRAFVDYLKKRRELDPEILRSRKVTFERIVIQPASLADWKASEQQLVQVEVYADRGIEDYDGPCLKADFANEYVGGGTLGFGNVQEELMFSVNPELIASMIFTRKFEANEALVIVGAERVSAFKGYGSSAKYTSPFTDNTGLDSKNRLDSHVVAIDALVLIGREETQYRPPLILRELNKAYAGFLGDSTETDTRSLRAICTGKWGCGMFRGDAQLKFLIQWAAASKAGRKFVFMTFGDTYLSRALEVVQKYENQSLGSLVEAISAAGRRDNLFEYLINHG